MRHVDRKLSDISLILALWNYSLVIYQRCVSLCGLISFGMTTSRKELKLQLACLIFSSDPDASLRPLAHLTSYPIQSVNLPITLIWLVSVEKGLQAFTCYLERNSEERNKLNCRWVAFLSSRDFGIMFVPEFRDLLS